MNNAQRLMKSIGVDDTTKLLDCMEIAPGVVKALIHYCKFDLYVIERITFHLDCEPEFEEIAKFKSEKEAKNSF